MPPPRRAQMQFVPAQNSVQKRRNDLNKVETTIHRGNVWLLNQVAGVGFGIGMAALAFFLITVVRALIQPH